VDLEPVADGEAAVTQPVCQLELGETHLAAYVGRWREALSEADDEGYARLADALCARQAARLGVAVDDWLAQPAEAIEQAGELLDEVDRDGLGALWAEPHLLGWFHQHFGEVERDASNRAHTKDEQKHASQTVTTQLYTPRWIADFLARGCLQAARAEAPTVCDPALGGGQMLLAALDAMLAGGTPLEDAAKRLYGVDLDARAVRIARRSLKLHIARMAGRRVAALEEAVDRNLRVADGLVDEFGSFDVVITNPPYMGSRSMPTALKERLRAHFRPFHADLYTAFIRRCHELSGDTVGVLAQQTVWFLSRFEKARSWLLDEAELVAFMHLGPHAFANLSGEKANVVAFVQRCGVPDRTDGDPPSANKTTFIDLRHLSSPAAKRDAFEAEQSSLASAERAAAFDILPGRVLAHWLPDRLRAHFASSPRLADIADVPGSQNKTGRNRRYVKAWSEVDPADLRRAPAISGEAGAEDGRWVFYSKGGRFSPWWGNWQNVVDWSDEARAFYADNRTSNLLAEKWWFREGICYTDFGGRTFNARWMPPGCVFDMAGPAIFVHSDEPDALFALLAILNSTPVRALLNALNPSLHYQVRDVRNLPVPEFGPALGQELAERARRLVEGMRRVAALVPGSPRCAFASGEDREGVRAFLDKLPALEHELDRLVCELYECPELLAAPQERPAHDCVAKITG
jgi:methylase of polypeptide subunit release factors